MTRRLPILCAAMMAVGCGSSSGSGTAAVKGPATMAVQEPDLKRLRRVPRPIGPAPTWSGGSVFLRRVFDDAEAMGHTEFQAADFAPAYVVKHELGHHVQTLLGISQQRAAADQQDPGGMGDRSVRFALQADCFAGMWMHWAYQQGADTPAPCGTFSQ